jgi:hypothetical protein
MAVSSQDTYSVYLQMRSALIERGMKCGLADSCAMATVQLYKRGVGRGCKNAAALATSPRRVQHYLKLYGVRT